MTRHTMLAKAVLLACFMAFIDRGMAAQPLAVPLVVPFDVVGAGQPLVLRIAVRTRTACLFDVDLHFDAKDAADRRMLLSQQAGRAADTGAESRTVALLMLVEIASVDGPFTYRVQAVPTLSQMGGDFFSQRFAEVMLEPGLYDVRVTNLVAAPDFAGRRATLTIGRHAKI